MGGPAHLLRPALTIASLKKSTTSCGGFGFGLGVGVGLGFWGEEEVEEVVVLVEEEEEEVVVVEEEEVEVTCGGIEPGRLPTYTRRACRVSLSICGAW